MDEADATLLRAWHLAFGVTDEAGHIELEGLLPALIAAGLVESDESTWSFTRRGIARVNELEPDSPGG